MVLTRRPPTTTWRRLGAFAACGAASKRLHAVKMTPAAPAASWKNSRRLRMEKPPEGEVHYITSRRLIFESGYALKPRGCDRGFRDPGYSRRSALPHGALQFDAQDIDYTLDAVLSERRQAPHVGPPDADGARPHG